MFDSGKRVFWFIVGVLSVLLAAIGVPLPLLPTTPFLLLAAFAFARSSERMHRWLLKHKTFGPLIENWHKYGSIDARSKRIALLVIVLTPVLSWLFGAPVWTVWVQVGILSCSAIFILTRPNPPEGDNVGDS
ncbi:YbaN family protein [Marinicella sp. W31]|uniref:YbaN family protein n=1 Tax=Marinicella sp. W31 TaxID=3023713 RepID=UPI0037565588